MNQQTSGLNTLFKQLRDSEPVLANIDSHQVVLKVVNRQLYLKQLMQRLLFFVVSSIGFIVVFIFTPTFEIFFSIQDINSLIIPIEFFVLVIGITSIGCYWGWYWTEKKPVF